MKTGIKILDNALEQIPFDKINSYKKFVKQFGGHKAQIMRDYVLFPLFNKEKISDLKGETEYRLEQMYQLLHLKFDWQKLVRETSREILKSLIFEHQKQVWDKTLGIDKYNFSKVW